MKQIHVLLADDQILVRCGICVLLERIPGVQLVAEAGDSLEALRLIELYQPDVAFVGLAMPKLSGLEIAARVAKDFPSTRLIILSTYASEEYAVEALRAGASGYLLKGAETADLEQTLKAVARGEVYLSPPLSRQVVTDCLQRAGGEGTSLDRLTPRQRQVLRLIAEGYTTKNIAQTLKISVKTVETHRTQLMDRLDIHDVASLVRYAIRVGLVSLGMLPASVLIHSGFFLSNLRFTLIVYTPVQG